MLVAGYATWPLPMPSGIDAPWCREYVEKWYSARWSLSKEDFNRRCENAHKQIVRDEYFDLAIRVGGGHHIG
jgi:hypothetical protein